MPEITGRVYGNLICQGDLTQESARPEAVLIALLFCPGVTRIVETVTSMMSQANWTYISSDRPI